MASPSTEVATQGCDIGDRLNQCEAKVGQYTYCGMTIAGQCQVDPGISKACSGNSIVALKPREEEFWISQLVAVDVKQSANDFGP